MVHGGFRARAGLIAVIAAFLVAGWTGLTMAASPSSASPSPDHTGGGGSCYQSTSVLLYNIYPSGGTYTYGPNEEMNAITSLGWECFVMAQRVGWGSGTLTFDSLTAEDPLVSAGDSGSWGEISIFHTSNPSNHPHYSNALWGLSMSGNYTVPLNGVTDSMSSTNPVQAELDMYLGSNVRYQTAFIYK